MSLDWTQFLAALVGFPRLRGDEPWGPNYDPGRP